MRLDIYLHQQQMAKSREYAKKMIENKLVLVDGSVVTKPAFAVDGSESVEVLQELFPYVGRGGVKLERAIHSFSISVEGKTCIDIGSSSGGFVDCLLQHGAKKVYAVDCGSNQLDPKLRGRDDVVVMERFNARYLSPSSLPEKCEIATMDVSFISQTLLYKPICSVLQPKAQLICLIKPQFECGPRFLGKGGIVKDPKIHKKVISDVIACAAREYLYAQHMMPSPIQGGDGNSEFLVCYCFNPEQSLLCNPDQKTVDDMIQSLF